MNDKDETKNSELANTPIDYVASFGKAALGSIPIAGPFLTELVGAVIPRQRMDRLVQFAEELDKRLGQIEQDVLHSKLKDENFTELLEEAMRQAARSTSDERRQYLASIIANGIHSEQITHIESRHLLRLLGEINDLEAIWLQFYAEDLRGDKEEFFKKHEEVLHPVGAFMGSNQATLDKDTIQDSYKQHLADLGLLKRKYKTDMKTKQPVFESSGEQKVSGYSITQLGRLLVRQITDQSSADDTDKNEEETD